MSHSLSLWDIHIQFGQVSNQNLTGVHWTFFSFVKDSKDLMDKLQSIELQDNEELVSFDVSALFTSIPVNQALDVINELIIQHQTNMDFKYTVGKAWYEVTDHLDREDMVLLKVVLNNYFPFRESSTNNYMVLQWVLHVHQ